MQTTSDSREKFALCFSVQKDLILCFVDVSGAFHKQNVMFSVLMKAYFGLSTIK